MKEINEHSHSAAGPVNGLMTYLPVGGQHPGKRHFSESDRDSC